MFLTQVPSLARIINILWKIATLATVLAFIYAKISYTAIIKVTIKDTFLIFSIVFKDNLWLQVGSLAVLGLMKMKLNVD